MGIQLLVPSGNKHETLSIFNVYAPLTHGNLPEVVYTFSILVEQHLTKVLKRHIRAINPPTPLAMQNILDPGETNMLMAHEQECYP
jgi:hypothetical protein